jgi:hypothetical protein
MKGFREFIIEVGAAFTNTIKHGDLELYVDYRHRQQEQSNRYGKVISLPMWSDTDIKVGSEVNSLLTRKRDGIESLLI